MSITRIPVGQEGLTYLETASTAKNSEKHEGNQ